jgi:Holliday junction resolvase RusA-like endonuclease
LSNEVLFECYFEVPRHSSKKNEKVARFNRASGKGFVGKSSKAKFAEDWMLKRLVIEKLKKRMDTITVDINADLIFYFPKSVYFTKAGVRSKKLPDASNLYELPQDCLQKVVIIENDTLIESHHGTGPRRLPIDGTKYFIKITLTQS